MDSVFFFCLLHWNNISWRNHVIFRIYQSFLAGCEMLQRFFDKRSEGLGGSTSRKINSECISLSGC